MRLRSAILHLLALGLVCRGANGTPPLQDPWEESYANLDATGTHVLGCWKFDELPLADASGHGAQLVSDRANLVPDGRFGGGLKCATATKSAVALPRHSPQGAFSAEMWVKVATDTPPTQTACLLDKQGARMEDFCWNLLPANERGLRQMVVKLGFGTFVKEFVSAPVFLPINDWRHLAFTYDGAGRVAFFADSQPSGEIFEERCGALQPGAQSLCLGSSIAGAAAFPGVIDEVRICSGVRGFAAFLLEINSVSHVWERMERSLPMKINCTNLRPQPLTGADMTFIVDGVEQSFIFPDLAPGAANINEFGPDTSLKLGAYTLEVVMGKGSRRVSRSQEFQIVGRRSQMLPVIMDGMSQSDLPQLQPLACTHWTGISNDDAPYAGTANKSRPLAVRPKIEAGLQSGLRTVAALDYDQLMLSRGFRKAGRDGKEFSPPEINAAHPEAANFMVACGNMFTLYYRNFNAWSGVLLGSSSLSKTHPGFGAMDVEAYRKFSGQEIPAEIQGDDVDWQKLPGFPTNRMIPDDHPILKYYRWFWSEGNGWKAVNEAWHRAYERRKQDRADTWIMHHPSVRQPSKAGSFSSVMYIGDESMDSRDPLMAGLCADQQFAMSAANEHELGVFGIMPLSWDRALASPVGAEGTAESIMQWDRISPLQRISVAPAILKENLWMMLSRPVKGLVLTDGFALRTGKNQLQSTLGATHPQSYAAFSDVAKRLLFPLGPMLARRQPWRSPVAMLESFTSQMMAGRGLYRGRSSRTLEVWQALQHAHIQTDIVYEEYLAEGGLDGRQILLLTDCDILPVSIVEKIRRWQEMGGKIIADEHLCPALKADALLSEPVETNVRASPPADTSPVAPVAPQLLPERITQLCKDLGWQPLVSCDSADVILHASQTGEAICLFVINDSRAAGSYVGQHGLVREAGLPVTANLNLGQGKVNIYDLSHAAFVLPKRADNGLSIPLKLGPSEGRVLLLSPSPLLEMQLNLPETATCGNIAEARINLMTSGGKPMPAAIPVAVSIRDANGAPAEFDGYHVVENGELILRLDLAKNETPGIWEVHVRELASGMESVKWMQVNP
ncbi:MAG: LamG domain-containing protein [Prosthecobacter sp.]|uniref:LamG-like jellyroll fold domain-containing protein n=1 Tax=Prosthecobacter sp. TaxID=1965333 RepID=UPI0025FD3D1A|nr:LamG-like jellyroll fold domain-containing protein [Prosthecobacter sp.]MCF7788206.1 LamG domain-containing protein [Prosthecobacter sp.]